MDRKQFLQSLVNKVLVDTYLKDVKVEYSEWAGKGDNYMGDMTRVTVTRGEETKIFFIKMAPNDPKHREWVGSEELNRIYTREALCYDKIFPKFDQVQDEYKVKESDRFKHAKSFLTCYQQPFETIMMEDLTQFGYNTVDRQRTFDWDLLKLTFKTMADFHALSFVMKEKKPQEYAEITKEIKHMGYIGDHVFGITMGAVNQAKDLIIDEKIKVKYENILPKAKQLLLDTFDYANSDPYNVITQGDSWIKNLMFRFKENQPLDLIMLDWQYCKITAPVVDLYTTFFTNVDSRNRREYYRKAFDFYYEHLGQRLREMDCDIDKCYPRHVFEDQLIKFSFYGIAIGIVITIFVHSEKAIDVTSLEKEGSTYPFCEKSKIHASEVIDDAVFFGLI